MIRPNSSILGLAFSLAVSTSLLPTNRVRADFIPIGTSAKYVTGTDAGVGPGTFSTASTAFNSVQAAQSFATAVGLEATTATIHFGGSFASLQPSENNVWSPKIGGFEVMTQGISYVAPPAPYQYGIATTSNAIANNADIGFGIDGNPRYEYVPLLNAGSASFTIHSDVAFTSFGFYVTGLGNAGGMVTLALDGKSIPMSTLTGSTQGGVQFVGYVGTAAVHDLSVIVPNVSGPTRDVFGLGDIRFALVPEPSSAFLIGLGCLGAIGLKLSRASGIARPAAAE